ncbi:hypothetical protein L3X38_000458 [Prunus dulcis]|uniref:OTU domain-containing protein n=1 Tax=Prunus dulcis TaxID=3755 RepID=A0AAD4ZJ98_PRUDU|nr:hypothetical protein L3X38_000458 [Prunus dulcis]
MAYAASLVSLGSVTLLGSFEKSHSLVRKVFLSKASLKGSMRWHCVRVESAHSQNVETTLPKKQPPKLPVYQQQIVNPQDLTQQYNDKLPAAIRPFIMGPKNIKYDGNCGFRAIAGLLGYGENSWRKVKRELLNELENDEFLYEFIFQSVESKREVEYRLDYFDDYPLEDSHSLPEYQRWEISIGLVEKHFVQLHLQPHHPMPPVINRWLDISNLKALDRYSPYRDRIDNRKELIGSFDVHLHVY